MAVDWDVPAPPWPQEELVEITSIEQAVELLDRWITSHRRLEAALMKMAWERDYYRDLARFTEALRVAEKSAPV